MPAVKVCENQCPKMVEMLENWTYPKDKDGKIVEGKLPEHNEYSHPGSAFYYLIANIYPPVKNSINLPSA
jgi:succinate dehydrogenase/fumarate reductase flavoprotein subunit